MTALNTGVFDPDVMPQSHAYFLLMALTEAFLTGAVPILHIPGITERSAILLLATPLIGVLQSACIDFSLFLMAR